MSLSGIPFVLACFGGSAPSMFGALLHQTDFNAGSPWPALAPEQRIYLMNSFSF